MKVYKVFFEEREQFSGTRRFGCKICKNQIGNVILSEEDERSFAEYPGVVLLSDDNS